MILYLEDWKKYPKATLQLNTKNRSFYRLALVFKKMGIKNHAFLLALHNPLLLDIDPWDENLTEEHIEMITEEVQENPWYFLREVVRVPPPAGTIPIIYKANRANISYFWLFFNHITTYLIQPRQTGKSLAYQIKDMYISDIGAQNYNISILSKDDKLRVGISRKIIGLFNHLPWYLKMLGERDVKNSERIALKAFNNIIDLYVGRNDPKAADNVGRGMTTPMADVDELGYIVNNHITIPAMLAGTTAAREVAEEQGIPYGTSFLTTPGKLNTKEGQYAFKMYKEAFRWSEHLFDKQNRNELLDTIIKNSIFKAEPIVLLEYNHRQLSFTDEWLNKRIEVARAEGDDAEADFLNRWVSGSLAHPLDKTILEVIDRSKADPVDYYESKEGYRIRLYTSKSEFLTGNKYSHYVISLDPSEAAGGDDIGMVIMDTYSGEVLGGGNFNETSIPAFSRFIADLLITLPNSALLVEKRSTGSTILEYVVEILSKENINAFHRVFNWVYNDADEYYNLYPEVFEPKIYDRSLYVKFKKQFGFATSGGGRTSRKHLYGSVVKGAGKFIGEYVRDKVLASQILSLTIRNGRVDHRPGEHDDMVIAWLLGFWFLTEARNKELYGIDVAKVLTNAIDAELVENATPEEREMILFQKELKEKIEILLEKLQNVKTEVEAIRLMGKVNVLKDYLDPKYNKSFNLDNILQEIKFYKKLKSLGYIK